MALTLDQVKTYLRVDGNDSDADITALLTAAMAYVNQQTGKTKKITGYNADGTAITVDVNEDDLYNLCLKLMIAHWYENRGVEIAGTLTKITHSVDALVGHISMCGDYV